CQNPEGWHLPPLLLRQPDVGRIVARRLLDDGLAADDALPLRVVGKGGLAVELPALVELGGDAVAEAGVVRTGEIAVELHGARPSPTLVSSILAGVPGVLRGDGVCD